MENKITADEIIAFLKRTIKHHPWDSDLEGIVKQFIDYDGQGNTYTYKNIKKNIDSKKESGTLRQDACKLLKKNQRDI